MDYIYPPRANDAVPRDATGIYADMGWIGQLKVNDTHIMLDYREGSLHTTWDRHGGTISNAQQAALPHTDISQLASKIPSGRCLLDGGFMQAKHKAIKGLIVLWDILIWDDEHLLGSTYESRYAMLKQFVNPDLPGYDHNGHNFGPRISDNVIIPRNLPASEWDGAWNLIAAVNAEYDQPLLEGLVFKNPKGTLKPGLREKNNSDWLGRSRVKTKRHRF